MAEQPPPGKVCSTQTKKRLVVRPPGGRVKAQSLRSSAAGKGRPILSPPRRRASPLERKIENALVIFDDKKVRRYAQSIGLAFTGIIGVLSQAYHLGLIEDVDEIVARLRTIDFCLPPDAEQLIQGE